MISFYWLEYTYYDHPNMYSLVLYSWGCNLKCYGCHNRHLAWRDYIDWTKSEKKSVKVCNSTEQLSMEEVSLAVKNPLIDMVILCGWEFLIYSVERIVETIQLLKEMNPNIYIRVDTNWSFPDKMRRLVATWLVDWFAIDIKWPYWNKDYYDIISKVIGTPKDYSKVLYTKFLESLDISKDLDKSIYRTVIYPIIEDKKYFDDIKSYVTQVLHKPHYFNNYVDL